MTFCHFGSLPLDISPPVVVVSPNRNVYHMVGNRLGGKTSRWRIVQGAKWPRDELSKWRNVHIKSSYVCWSKTLCLQTNIQ